MNLFRIYCRPGLLVLLGLILIQTFANAALRIPKAHESIITTSSSSSVSSPPKVVKSSPIRTFFTEHFFRQKNHSEHADNRVGHKNDTPIFGILSLGFAILAIGLVAVYAAPIGFLLAIPAYIFGFIGLKHKWRGLAIAGFIAASFLLIIGLAYLLVGSRGPEY